MRCRDRLLVIALALLAPAAAYAQGMGSGAGVPDVAMVYPRGGATSPSLDYIFSAGSYYQSGVSACVSAATCLTVTRVTTNGSATDLLPTSASGQAITTFSNNVARISSALGGLLVEEARVNQLLNATVPATQTTASLATGTYTLWVNGSGSATMSAGTGTGCGTAAATQGTPVNFTISVAGTCTVTVAGSLKAFQLELGAFGTSLCSSGGSACSRGGDVVQVTTVPTFGLKTTMSAGGTFSNISGNPSIGGVTTASPAFGNALYFVPAGWNFVPGAGADPTAPTAGVPYKTAAAIDQAAGTINAVSQGGTVVSNSYTPTNITFGSISIGSDPWSNTLFMDGVIIRFTLWPTVALTSAQLQALTK